MRHILRFRVFEVMDSPPQWRIHDLCTSIGLGNADYAINHDLTVLIRGEDWDEGDLTKVRDAGGSWDSEKGRFVDQSGSVVDPRAKRPSSRMDMVECVYCGNDMPRLRLDKFGYKMCVKCAQSTEKSLKTKGESPTRRAVRRTHQPATPTRRPRKRRVKSTFSFDEPMKPESERERYPHPEEDGGGGHGGRSPDPHPEERRWLDTWTNGLSEEQRRRLTQAGFKVVPNRKGNNNR